MRACAAPTATARARANRAAGRGRGERLAGTFQVGLRVAGDGDLAEGCAHALILPRSVIPGGGWG